MRRKDREVVDTEKIEGVVSECEIIRLGFIDKDEVYIVPMNFGYINDNREYTFFFHSAREGRKINLIKQGKKVGFEMETNYKVHSADTACKFSSSFKSVIGTGTVEIIEDSDEKKYALNRIMLHNSGESNWDFEEKALAKVLTFKLKVINMSCKEHK